MRQLLPKPALKTLLSTCCWAVTVIVWFGLLAAASVPASASSTVRAAAAPADDRAATQALIEAEYRLAKATLVRAGSTEAALARAAKTLGKECKGVLRGGPDESVLEEDGPPASRPRLSGRARGELARSELEKQTIEVEISEQLSTAADHVLRGPYEAYVRAVTSLAWSDPTINTLVGERTKQVREHLAAQTVPVCADMRAWAASDFHTLSPVSKRLQEAREARYKPTVEGNLKSLLEPSETRVGRTLVRRTTVVNEQRREKAREAEVFKRADYQMSRALGEKVSRFEQHQLAPVIAKRRTSAGTTFVIRANIVKGVSRSCKHEVDVEVLERNGGSGDSVCLSEGARARPSGMCSGSVETVELATPSDVRAARFRLRDGGTVMVSVVQIPAKYGGPGGVLIAAFRSYNRHPVSAQELNASGTVLRTVALKRIDCTKKEVAEGPGPPQFITLAKVTTPTGESRTIQATLMHFRGRTEFSLDSPPSTHSAELNEEEEQGTSKQFQWGLSTECEPHRFTLIDGILTPPGAFVLVRTTAGLVELTKVELAASTHAPGPLFYGVYTTPPTEIVVERADGTILYTESLAAKAAEETEYCEGYAEP